MKIIKYTKKSNGKYQILLEDNEKIDTYEDVILKNNLLYKNKIDSDTYNKIIKDNDYEQNYIKCVKYISVRLRSINEMEKYLKNKQLDNDMIIKLIDKLKKDNLLDDNKFAYAFIHDKFSFTTMGPYRIKQQLYQHNIDDLIVNQAVDSISSDDIKAKIYKLIDKQVKTSKKKGFLLKNKIYNKLLNLGYQSELILEKLNDFEF